MNSSTEIISLRKFIKVLVHESIIDQELESYRLQALNDITLSLNSIKAVVGDAIGRRVIVARPIGSVTSRRQFSPESDIDIAFSVKPQPNEMIGLSEKLSNIAQEAAKRFPIGSCGVINTLVFVGPIK